MYLRKHYRTIVLSDIHLGTTHSKVEEVSQLLRSVNCDKLILNGDIIDGWHMKKNGTRKWQPAHTQFFKIIMKLMEKCGTEVIYVRGNHDDFLDNLAPIRFANIQIVKDYVLKSEGKSYFVTHGDIFDRVTTQMKWLALLGDMGIRFYFGLMAGTTNTARGGENLISRFHNGSNRRLNRRFRIYRISKKPCQTLLWPVSMMGLSADISIIRTIPIMARFII